jgi:hypothetical protein
MWQNGREHGKGCYTTAGMCYIGNFADGVIDGHGIHSWVRQSSFLILGRPQSCLPLCVPVCPALTFATFVQDDGSSFEGIHSMGYVVRPGEFREAQDQSSAVGADYSPSRRVLAGYVVSPQQQFMGSPGTAPPTTRT